MKTQQTTVTYQDGTVTFGRESSRMSVIVHTGAVKVTVTREHLWSLTEKVHFAATGPAYLTATVEAPNGQLSALTDPRASVSPFALGWR